MCSSHSEVFVDHTSNLSSTEKSVLHLRLLLLQTDSLLEERVRDDLLQSRRDLRIEHLKIRESMPSNWLRRLKIVHWFDHLYFFDPQHSVRRKAWTETCLGLETRFPTLECWRIREFIEMHFWDLIPRLFNHAILRTSSFCMRGRGPSWKRPCKSRCGDCKNVKGFSPMHWLARQVSLYSETQDRTVLMPYFSNFQRNLLEVHSVQVGLQKRFLTCQMSSVYRAAGKNCGLSFHEDSEYS